MLFNSVEFTLFLPTVFVLYWFVARQSYRLQNIILLLASYFFYGSWNPVFLLLLIFSTFLDFFCGLKIAQAKSVLAQKYWLVTSIAINLGFLGYFKYCNFFATSLISLLGKFNFAAHYETLNIILPIGISFYTFHGLSYVFDIYNKKITPSQNVIEYALFVSFFPLLVAGPIERATHLLPQIVRPRTFDKAKAIDGLRQMLWGFFKKIVIADGCSDYVNMAFENPYQHNGSTLLVGAILFSFQIYCDFSGYSDIALGTARLFGFELLRNFSFPYFSRDIAEFWRRWHISLSNWFKDYLYFPLGGSKGGKLLSIRNTLIIFAISGLWHGANWTYLIWGIYHSILFMPFLLLGINRKHTDIPAYGRFFPSLKEFLSMTLTFIFVTIGWIIFRSENITISLVYITGIFDPSLFTKPVSVSLFKIAAICLMLIVEWMQRGKEHGLQTLGISTTPLRWTIYMCLFIICLIKFEQNHDFIYFQF
jgi:alginate O-acetyltransferase complex protein AlgI